MTGLSSVPPNTTTHGDSVGAGSVIGSAPGTRIWEAHTFTNGPTNFFKMLATTFSSIVPVHARGSVCVCQVALKALELTRHSLCKARRDKLPQVLTRTNV